MIALVIRWLAVLSVAVLLVLPVLPICAAADAPIRVASKNFNESYILAEIMSQVLEAGGLAVERRFGLGGTLICYEALKNDEIDVYPEYSGTLSQAILNLPDAPAFDELSRLTAKERFDLLQPFGFNNTYAMVLREAQAAELGVTTISDLKRARNLNIVVSHEFLERADGWPGLVKHYGFSRPTPTGIEHGLAYQAIAEGSIDVTDAYSTDGELLRYRLRALSDDQGFFPEYLAFPLVRDDLPNAARAALGRLAGTIDEDAMRALNARVVLEGASFAEVAAEYLSDIGVQSAERDASSLGADLWRNTVQHLKLTFSALSLAIVAALALSLAVFSTRWLANGVIYVCGLLQTIPSIALLALMIPMFGIGMVPAVIALFLYSLLPILRNSITALTTIDPTLVRVSVAMGLSYRQRLRHVYIPLSMPSILAGVRTAAVISIGTATLAAFIGAGGLGDPIVTGLSLNNVNLILQGAIPAAVLAVLVELIFEAIEYWVLPKHLRT